MKQTAASYQFELSEEELNLICTAVNCAITDTRESYEYLQNKLEEEMSQEATREVISEFYSRKEELTALLKLYNGFGSPIGKLMSISL